MARIKPVKEVLSSVINHSPKWGTRPSSFETGSITTFVACVIAFRQEYYPQYCYIIPVCQMKKNQLRKIMCAVSESRFCAPRKEV